MRGRAWIPVLGFMLAAIVGLRVEVLKLSSGVGTQIQEAAELQSSNATLRSSVSELSGNQRIEQLAKTMGMVMPGPMDVHFVPVSAGTHLSAAIRAIHTPESETFLSGLAAERDADETSVTEAVNTSAVGDLAAAISDSTSSDSGDTSSAAIPASTDSASANTTDSADSPAESTTYAPTTASDSSSESTTASDNNSGSSDLGTTQPNAADAGTTDVTTDGTTDGTTDSSDAGTTSGTTGSATTGGSTTGGSSLAG